MKDRRTHGLDLRGALDRRLAHGLDRMSHGLCIYDADNRLEFANDRFLQIYRQPKSSARAGATFLQLLTASVAIGNYPGRTAEEVWRERKAFIDRRQPGTFLQRLGDGRLIAIAHRPLEGGGWVAVYEDITERELMDTRLRFLARHDALTGLPNRLFFQERLEAALAEPDLAPSCALLCLDLDGFKLVNDRLGHAGGDALLRHLAVRLQGELRETDVAARLGGDEFAVLLPQTDAAAATALSNRLSAALARPYDLGSGRTASVGVSVGVAIAPADATTPDALMRLADEALYRAKRTFRDLHAPEHLPCPVGREPADSRDTDGNPLVAAMRAGHLQLHYQPIVRCSTGLPAAYEALLRWTDPERGIIPPEIFIREAEACNTIIPLTCWVLDRVGAEAVSWTGSPQLNINLSPACLTTTDVEQSLARMLASTGLDPGRLVLEITETMRFGPAETVVRNAQALLARGVRLWLDDFGVGFANVAHLRRIPFSAVKLDRSFLADETPWGLRLFRSTLAFARTLDLEIVVEGVETQEQLARATESGCDWIQGCFLDCPSPARLPHLGEVAETRYPEIVGIGSDHESKTRG